MAFVLQLFGGFRLTCEDGKAVTLPDRGRALLAYLAVAPSPVPRQVVAELLSTGEEQEQRKNLRQAVYLIRKAIADDAVISTQDGDLVLNDALVCADVRRFLNATAGSDEYALKDAIELYRGPFLEGEKSPSLAFEDWLGARRAEFGEQAVGALLKLARSHEAAGLHSSSLAHARQALTLDSLCEDAHRQVMRSLAALGHRSNALRQYDVARQLLAKDLGVSPEPETETLRESIARGEEAPKKDPEPIQAGSKSASQVSARTRLSALTSWQRATIAVTVIPLLIVGGTAVSQLHSRSAPSISLPAVAVLPFTNTSGDATQDYLGYGIAEEITTSLSTHPGIRVVSKFKILSYDSAPNVQQVGQQFGARYVLDGSVRKTNDTVKITAQLMDITTGDHLWARRFERRSIDIDTIQDEIATEISESLLGPTGEIAKQEQRVTWHHPAVRLQEREYELRGEQFYFRFTREAHARAREIWQEGLTKFPQSVRLRLGLAASYRHSVEVGWSVQPEQDLEKAWQLVNEAALAPHSSRLDEWLSHWVMAKLAQWCREDYERSIAEAQIAIQMVPYDASSRADLAELLANAGNTQEAIQWLKEAIHRDPKPPDWYRGNLAWAYYLEGRYQDAITELEQMTKPRRLVQAASNVRLGRIEDAQSAVADFLKDNPGYTLADEARRPVVPSLKRRWLNDLREAGLPENAPKAAIR